MTKRRGDVGIMFVAKGEGSVDNAWLMSRDPSNYRLTGNGNWHRIDGTVDYHCANSDHEELHIDHIDIDTITDYRLTRNGNWRWIDGTVDYHCANSDHIE
ncbi:hypothetical protein J6590_075807 [Homalodisca vitripennis]|nr:hypothetical protein J6590_075807 [Homalodisca vitripennis]